MVSNVPQGNVLDLLLFIHYEIWNDLENKIISCADDLTLKAEVSSPSDRINVSNSLNRDLTKNVCGIKLKTRNIHSISISHSRTPHSYHLPLILFELDLKVSSSLKVLEYTIN